MSARNYPGPFFVCVEVAGRLSPRGGGATWEEAVAVRDRMRAEDDAAGRHRHLVVATRRSRGHGYVVARGPSRRARRSATRHHEESSA